MMKRIEHFSMIILAACAFVSVSCDKATPDNTGTSLGRTSSAMRPNVTWANAFTDTKAGQVATLNKVYDSDDDFVIEEYVSDINAVPETKGFIIDDKNEGVKNKYGSFFVNAYRPFYKGELMEEGDKDNTDNDDDVYDNGSKSKTTKAVRDFSMRSVYGNNAWGWSGNMPHWRNKAVYSIWSMAPANSSGIDMGSSTVNPAMPQPAWTDLSSIPDIDPAGKTPEQVEQEEQARLPLIQNHFRSLEFDYTLPLYAPTTASTSIYKDLLFAYNEESRAFVEENGKLKVDANGENIIENNGPSTFNVHFYHALAAVQFELETETDGADIHSVTLCCTDASGNISTTTGLATKGHCTVTGLSTSSIAGEGSKKVNFEWTTDADKKRPMHFVFNDGTTSTTKINGGYATGDKEGVLFMIPQTASNIKVIVEFSKYGGTQYYTRVYNTGINVNWEAGKKYTYKFRIGEFHVPGENIAPNLSRIYFVGLKNANAGITVPDTPLSTKGVTKVGLVLDKYGLACKNGQTAVMYGVCDGNDKYKDYSADGKTTAHSVAELITLAGNNTTNPPFTFNFVGVSTDALPGTNGKIYSYGSDNVNETYKNLYIFSETNGGNAKPPTKYTSNNGSNLFYVFNLEPDTDKFEVMFKTGSNDNSGSFDAYPRCMIVLEVKTDDNLPGNFNTINWDAINNS